MLRRLRLEDNPIQYLPDELLREIFLQLICATPSRDNRGVVVKQDVIGLLAITLTHVCGRWREIVISDPTIWAVMDEKVFKRKDILDLYLTRSQDVLLDFVVSYEDVEHRDPGFKAAADVIQRVVFEEAHRLRSIRLDTSLHLAEYTLGDNDSDARIPFPVLESLEILVSFRDDESAEYQRGLMRWDMPRLRRVLLQQLHIEWRSFVLPSTVTHLELMCCVAEYTRKGLEDVLDVLEKLPELEVLILHSSLPVETSHNTYQSSPRTIHFPHLRKLRIEDCELINLHKNITYSSLQSLQLDVVLTKNEIPPFCSKFFSHNLLSPGEKWTLATLMMEPKPGVVFNLCTDPCNGCNDNIHRLYLNITEDPEDSEMTEPEIWQCIFDAAGPSLFSGVTQLIFNDGIRIYQPDFGIPGSMLASLLEATPCLKYLEIIEPSVFDILTDFSNGTVVLPDLETLCLNMTIIDSEEEDEDEDVDFNNVNIDVVCDCLAEREERGSKLLNLSVMTHEQLESLSPESHQRLRDTGANLSIRCGCSVGPKV